MLPKIVNKTILIYRNHHQVYLPYGARVKITLKTDEKVVATPKLKLRDPRNHGQMKSSAPKPGHDRNLASVELEENVFLPENNPGPKKEEEKVVQSENPELDLEKHGDQECAMEEKKVEKSENLLQILKALPLPIDPEIEEEEEEEEEDYTKVESDSDEGKLQIDESFDETTTLLPDPAPTTREVQMEKLQRSEVTLDEENNNVNMIQNSAAHSAQTAKNFGENPKKETEEEEEVMIVKVKKSKHQLEMEKQHLRKLLEEREVLRATLEEAGILQEDFPINFGEVEEGELSDSYDNDDKEKAKVDSLSNPESRFKKYWDDFPEDEHQGPKC